MTSTGNSTTAGISVVDLTSCPECGGPAEVLWRDVCASTDGPVEHARVRCLAGHLFLGPVEYLGRATVGPL